MASMEVVRVGFQMSFEEIAGMCLKKVGEEVRVTRETRAVLN